MGTCQNTNQSRRKEVSFIQEDSDSKSEYDGSASGLDDEDDTEEKATFTAQDNEDEDPTWTPAMSGQFGTPSKITIDAAGSASRSSQRKRTRATAADQTPQLKRTRFDQAVASYASTNNDDPAEYTMEEIAEQIRSNPALLKKAGLELSGGKGQSAKNPIEVEAPESPLTTTSVNRLLFPSGDRTQSALAFPTAPTGPSRVALVQSYKEDTQNKNGKLRVVKYAHGLDALPPSTVCLAKEPAFI